MGQAVRNVNDGISLLHIAEGGLETLSEVIVRMRELAVQASTETYNDSERSNANAEFNALAEEFDQIAERNIFNGISLLDGSNTTIAIQIGIDNNADNKMDITLSSLASTSSDLSLSTTFTNGISTQSNAATALSALDSALDSINTKRSLIGSNLNRFENVLGNLSSADENIQAAISRVVDADIAMETSVTTKEKVLMDASSKALKQAVQVGAYSSQLISQ
jgi:flagellin